MSERGVFAVDRGIFDHPVLNDDEPFSRREAWLWMVSEAAWKDGRRKCGGNVVQVRRGQLAHSLRFMAKAWRWSEARVRRFLDALKTDAMIDAATDAGVTVVTIRKYNEYQRVSLPSDAASDAPSDAEATQTIRQGNISSVSEAKASSTERGGIFEDDRTRLFGAAREWLERHSDRKNLRSLIGRWLKQNGDDVPGLLAIIRRSAEERVADPVPWIERALKASLPEGPDWQARARYLADHDWLPEWGNPQTVVPGNLRHLFPSLFGKAA